MGNIVLSLNPYMTLEMGFEKDLITKVTNTELNLTLPNTTQNQCE